MLLSKGENVHIITRRLFENEPRRHFIGKVDEATDALIRVQGYVFVFNQGSNEYLKRKNLRTRIFSLVDAMNIVNVLPPTANIEEAVYGMSKENRLIVTDKSSFSLDINEFGHIN